MIWRERSRVDERMQLVGEYLKGERAMAALCEDFGVSRKTAYKWAKRYLEYGPEGLLERSRAPHNHPNRVDAAVKDALVTARRRHPHWGARKLLAWLGRKHPELALPAPSTVSALFNRTGLSRAPRARRTTPPFTDPFADADKANRVWCADFKEDFKLGNSQRCYPLTLTDACSRAVLRCSALRSTRTEPAWRVFESAFREYGLPERMRTDNGTPFASRGAGGLSRLSVWWAGTGASAFAASRTAAENARLLLRCASLDATNTRHPGSSWRRFGKRSGRCSGSPDAPSVAGPTGGQTLGRRRPSGRCCVVG